MGHVFGYFRVLLEMGTPERLRIAVSCMLIGPAYLCATDLSAQLVINEVCSANNVVLEAPEGDHPDWVELHNTGSSPIQLHDHYFSDKPSEPALWRLPVMVLDPDAYIVLFSGNSAGRFPFGIDRQGERIVLSDLALQPEQIMDVPELGLDHSFGGDAGGAGAYFFAVPTPGAANTTTVYPGYAPKPVLDRAPGYYAGSVTVSASASSGAVHWTFTGREPDLGSAVASSPVELTAPTVVLARTYRDQWLPSDVVTATYLTGVHHELPVVSLSVDPDSMFHEDLGLYMPGPNADPEYPHYGANFWSERSLPVRFEFFEADGVRGFVQQVDVKMHGGRRSRNNPQRPLQLTAKGKYGKELMHYPFFPERPEVADYNTLVLRNAGGDFCIANFRDGLFHEISLHNDLDIDELAFRPAALYINGEYWGMVEIRERIDEHHLENNYGADPDSVLIMEEENWSVQGDTIHFWDLMQFIYTQDLNDPSKWAHVDSLLDLHSCKDYFALEMQAGNVDWPSNNLKYWKPSIGQGKWRYLMYDLDATMQLYGWIEEDLDMFYWVFVHSQGFVHTELFRGLMTNDEFRRTFLNRLADLMNTVMKPENFQAEIDRITDTFSSEIERHYARWDCWYQMYVDHAFGIIPHFAQARDAYVRQSVLDYYAFPNAPLLDFEVFPPAAGSVLINTITPELPFSGYYFNGNAIDLTVQPTDGLIFDHWGYSAGTETSSAMHWKHSFASDGKVTAYFRSASGEMAVYPNPATNVLTIGLDAHAAGQADVRITDMRGRELARYTPAVSNGVNGLTIDIGALSAGVYVITSEVNGDRRIARFVKQ